MVENRFAKYKAAPETGNRFDKYNPAPVEVQPETRSVSHDAGITGRAIAHGLSTPVAMPGNLITAGVNALFGTKLKSPSQGFDEFIDTLGTAQPETADERIYSDTVSGATNPLNMLIPGGGVSGAMGGAAGGATREAGGGPVLQIAASTVGGAGPGMLKALGNTAKSAGETAVSVARPFTQGGRENIVGRTLNREATDPATAVENMKSAPEFVPGSKPTTGVASKDPGLLGVEKGMRARKPTDFAEVDTANQSARTAHLDEIAGTPEDIKIAKVARKMAGDESRTAAFEGKQPASISNTQKTVKEISESPSGVRDAVAKSMTWVNKKLDDALHPTAKKQINKLTKQLKGADKIKKAEIKQQIETLRNQMDPERLYAARQDVADAIAGKFDSEQPALRLASKELAKIRDNLDADIEAGAPGYKQYLEDFREQSKPIEQMETLQDIKIKGENAVPNPITGERPMSQAKWNNLVNKNREANAKVLTSEQMKRLDAIAADLDRGASLDSFKAVGSNTVQNLTMGNLLGSLVSGQAAQSPLTKTLMRPLAFLYKIPEEEMQNMLLEAMKDPQTAANLMAKATPQAAETLGKKLARNLKQAGTGTVAGALAKPQDKSKNE